MYHVPRDTGWIEVITGCMFSGKTEELIRRLNRARYARQTVLIFKPRIDERYAKESVVSHSKQELTALAIDDATEIIAHALDADVIGMHAPNAYYSSRLAGSFLVGRAAVYMGIADAAFEFLVRYLREKVQSSEDAVMQYRIGQLEIERQQATSLLYRAAWVWQEAIEGRGDMTECATYAALCHTGVSESALRITSEALPRTALPTFEAEHAAFGGDVSDESAAGCAGGSCSGPALGPRSARTPKNTSTSAASTKTARAARRSGGASPSSIWARRRRISSAP